MNQQRIIIKNAADARILLVQLHDTLTLPKLEDICTKPVPVYLFCNINETQVLLHTTENRDAMSKMRSSWLSIEEIYASGSAVDPILYNCLNGIAYLLQHYAKHPTELKDINHGKQ